MADQKITQLSEDTAPQPSDLLVTVDDPGGTPLSKKTTIQNALKALSALTEDLTPDPAADYILVYDASASTVKKVLIQSATANKVATTGNETIAGIKTFSSFPITPSSLPTTSYQVANKAIVDAYRGKIKGSAHAETATKSTQTTTFPFDDTIPQNTEGTEIITCAYTPTSATNKLLVMVSVFVSPSTADYVTCALFQDTTANAIEASMFSAPANYIGIVWINHWMTAGTTSSTTFKARVGAASTNILTINGALSNRYYGGVVISSITILEIEP